MFHSAMIFKSSHDARYLRHLLADSDIDTNKVAPLLIYNSVQGDSGLAGRAVAYNKLALSPADGEHAVYRLDAGLHRGVDRGAQDDVGGNALDGAGLIGIDRALAVDGAA